LLFLKEEQKNLLIIFTRNPELGKCKTRLAATIGEKAALEVYKLLLAHTAKVTREITARKQVYYSDTIWEHDIWNPSVDEKKVQAGADLGERMEHAFATGFEMGFQKIIIMGSDLYDLEPSDVEAAFQELDHADYVLGPALDGGYYLLGMKQMNAKLFKNKSWGTATVLRATLDDLKEERVALLKEKNDIDVYEDIKDLAVFQPFLISNNL
jgi:rSAM/selenodomain-associated transferase 1